MSVRFNHTIVLSRDKCPSATFLAEVLGLSAPTPFGHFLVVQLDNGVSLDFLDAGDEKISSRHYAFLIDETDFDPIRERVRGRGLTYWADPFKKHPGEINRNDGGRGIYFDDPDGHLLEVLTRPYGSGASFVNRAFVTSRVIDAPRARVFRAFTDPAHLARWWGPKGFTNTFHEFDLRPGGRWRFVMHGPDGTDYRNESVFTEIVAPERIVFEHVSAHRFELTITFADLGSRTEVGWRQVFDTVEECRRIAPVVVEANEQNLDRLVAEVCHVA